MIKFCVEQWENNKAMLEKNIRENTELYQHIGYKELLKKIVIFILNESSDYKYDDEQFDAENVTEIDNGDYQGTLLYLIPKKHYQPSESDYLMTYVGYGSCSGCDTLQAVHEETGENFIGQIMSLSLHLIQNTIKPYNNGWGYDENFDPIDNQTKTAN